MSKEHYEKCPKCGEYAFHTALSHGILLYGDSEALNGDDDHILSDEEIEADSGKLQVGATICFECGHIENPFFEEPRTPITPEKLTAAGIPSTKTYVVPAQIFLMLEHPEKFKEFLKGDVCNAISVCFCKERSDWEGVFFLPSGQPQIKLFATSVEQLFGLYHLFFNKPYNLKGKE